MTDHLDIDPLRNEPAPEGSPDSLESLCALAASISPPPKNDAEPAELDLGAMYRAVPLDAGPLVPSPFMPATTIEHALPLLSSFPPAPARRTRGRRWQVRLLLCGCALGAGAALAAVLPGPEAPVTLTRAQVAPQTLAPGLAATPTRPALAELPAAAAPIEPPVQASENVEPVETVRAAPRPATTPTRPERRRHHTVAPPAAEPHAIASVQTTAAAAPAATGSGDVPTPAVSQSARAASTSTATGTDDTVAAPAAPPTRASDTAPRNIDALIAAAVPDGASSARTAETQAVAAARPPQPSREQVREALEGRVPALQECAGSQHGLLEARITFAGTGRVRSAIVTGAFAGTPQGSCIARQLRRVSVDAFANDSFVVQWPARL